ncbi:hypothetical protein Taro_020345 [Colocasia esculenta]|uniref:Uncharacterized protein n=1 Tax=Colocasia esculenta TaxID=4460 RepID=A0A843V878_COLES|nr:hypothetical protein [Colocasia esculenta]
MADPIVLLRLLGHRGEVIGGGKRREKAARRSTSLLFVSRIIGVYIDQRSAMLDDHCPTRRSQGGPRLVTGVSGDRRGALSDRRGALSVSEL